MNISVERFGKTCYMLGNFALMFGVILAYQFTPFDGELYGALTYKEKIKSTE